METPAPLLTKARGSYAIALHLPFPTTITVGALGIRNFAAGYYLYVGSAWGPGGLAARVGRHLRGPTTTHWHIDYLRARSRPIAIWLAPQRHEECAWIAYLATLPEISWPVPGFGASDCPCATHLAYLDSQKQQLPRLPHAEGPYLLA